MHLEKGANDIDVEELQALFNDDDNPVSPTENEGTESNASNDEHSESKENEQPNDISKTKAFANRLAKEKIKIANEERENIAKSLGFNSFDELQKSRERKTLEDKGFNPDEISPVVEELVKQRMDNDPRMKELEQFRAKQIAEFGKKELAEISKLTGGEITSLEQLSDDVLELWKKKGSLKSAYIELHGEELIMRANHKNAKGSTSHLNNLSGNSGNSTKRPLNDKEKDLWRLFNPKMTKEEIDKIMVDK